MLGELELLELPPHSLCIFFFFSMGFPHYCTFFPMARNSPLLSALLI